jgi:hypothetical protein
VILRELHARQLLNSVESQAGSIIFDDLKKPSYKLIKESASM